MAEQEEFDYQIKVVLVGDPAVGKTNLLLRYTKNDFKPDSTTTINIEFSTKTAKIEDSYIRA